MGRIFVTGGAGFIGSAVTRTLLDEGHSVTVFDDLSQGNREAVDERATFVEGSVADEAALHAALPGHDAVIHMAAFIEVAESVKDPLRFVENNVVNSVRLLEAMRKAGVPTIVFSSSATVYGTPKRLPLTEADELGVASNPYGASKVATEFFCQVYHTLYAMNVVILRYFNPYGPGELHKPESHAIPNLIRAALANEPLPVYWQGEQIRDFIYIDDLARAHTSVLDQKGLHYFNVGTERGVKVKEVITTLGTLLQKELTIKDLGERPGDIMANYASAQKLHDATGWRASVDLTEGLKRTIAFYKNAASNPQAK